MTNNGELNSSILSFYDVYKSNNSFNDIRESLDSRKENDTFTPTQLIEIKQEYQKRRNQLEGFKNSLSNLAAIIKPELYNNLMNALSNQLASLDMMINDVDNYINTDEDKYIESIVYGFSMEKENNEILLKYIIESESNFSRVIFPKALAGEIDIQQLESLISNFEQNSSIYKNLSEIIKAVNINNNKQPNDNETEVEKSLISVEPQANIVPKEEEKEKPKEPTLQDKINRVQYKNTGNINTEVQTLSAEDQLAQIKVQIDTFKSKEKLSVRETIQLHTLHANELSLQIYMNGLENNKQSFSDKRRDKKIENVNSKIGDIDSNLKLSQENSKQYSSKTMRFFSARYQEQLKYNIATLQQKNGMLAINQRASSVANFNKQSKKMARKAKTAGLLSGIGEIAARKIEELKKFKASVFEEIGNIKQDINRFSSQMNEVSTLQEMQGIMPDNVISFEEARRKYGNEKQMVA